MDESGKPISGAEVAITYTPINGNEPNVNGSGTTNANGQYSFTGTAYHKIFIEAKKEAYYPARQEKEAFLYDDENNIAPQNPNVQLVLKKIIGPVPMFARSFFEVILPKMDTPIGLDLEKMDWIAPYGSGVHGDIYFEMKGHYNHPNDRSAELSLLFPNDGDGIIEFQATEKQGSFLRSPQVAPLDGYTSHHISKRSRILAKGENGEGKWVVTGDRSRSTNFLIRVRTELDEHGNIKSANYGKIYGDLDFFGYHPDGSYIHFDALYYNPKPNDRSLEFDLKKNRFQDLSILESPKLP